MPCLKSQMALGVILELHTALNQIRAKSLHRFEIPRHRVYGAFAHGENAYLVPVLHRDSWGDPLLQQRAPCSLDICNVKMACPGLAMEWPPLFERCAFFARLFRNPGCS